MKSISRGQPEVKIHEVFKRLEEKRYHAPNELVLANRAAAWVNDHNLDYMAY